MTSSKQGLRLHSTPRSQIQNSPSSCDVRSGNISLYVNGCPDELRPFLDLSSKVARCFKPSLNIIESSSNTETISNSTSSLSSSSSSRSSLSSTSSSSSTLSSRSNNGKDENGRNSSCHKDSSPPIYSNASGFPGSSEFSDNQQNSSYPSFSITIFLRLMDADPSERLKPNATPRDKRASSLLKILKSHPWKLHHTEHVNNAKVIGKVNSVTTNPTEFYCVSPQFPVWGVRHVHYGREHIRVVLNTSHSLWDDQVHFYSLVLGLDCDLLKDDFCLFTVQRDLNVNYDVQLALKRLPQNVSLQVLESVHIQIRVTDLGKLVALFPNVCEPVSDVLWQTFDHDGNKVMLNVVRNRQNKTTVANIDDAVYECMISPMQNYQRTLSNSKCTQTGYEDNRAEDEEVCNLSNGDNSNSNVYVNSFESSRVSDVYVNCDRSCNTSTSTFNNRGKLTSKCVDGDMETTNGCVEHSQDFTQTKFGNTKGIILSDDEIHVFRFTNDDSDTIGKLVQEDEESLTLTNLSEESGIIVLQDDEGAWCDGEGESLNEIRPCLRKHPSSSTCRTNSSSSRKVRFSDEIMAFAADDTQSRLSSGFESDEQSDVELDPTYLDSSRPSRKCSDHKQYTHANVPNNSVENPVTSFQNNVAYNDTNINPNPTKRITRHSSHSNHKIKPNQQSYFGLDRVNTFQYRDENCHNAQSSRMFRPICPPSYEVALATKKKNQMAASKKFETTSLQQNCHLNDDYNDTNLQSENTNSLSNKSQLNSRTGEQYYDTRTSSQSKLSNTSKVNDSKNGFESTKKSKHCNTVSSNIKQLGGIISESVSQPSNQCTLNGNDATTNFTLRFDTCPMSGGQPRQEQTGFYV